MKNTRSSLNKASIQLEGCRLLTEISKNVYEDLKASNSQYITVDIENNIIGIKKSFLKKNKQVQNVTRYFVQFVNGEMIIQSPNSINEKSPNSSFQDDIIKSNWNNKTIAILLESPHVDEYEVDSVKLKPIAPAQGLIGKRIETNLKLLLKALANDYMLEENHLYRILIIHAIPLQASLHFIHGKSLNNHYRELRDKIWLKMWMEIPELKKNFSHLISSFKEKSIIVNACPKSIKPFIHEELVQKQKKYILLECSHPSSTEPWNQSVYRLN